MEYNDFELVSLAQEGSEEALNILYKKYQHVILYKAKKIYRYIQNNWIDLNDIIQEATIGLNEAIKNYNQDENTVFYTFASVCIDRALLAILKRQKTEKNKLFIESLSLDYEEEYNLYNSITDGITPETKLLNNTSDNELYEKIIKNLTDFEECIFNLKIQGFNGKEISILLDINNKTVYNYIVKIKRKINNILLNNI